MARDSAKRKKPESVSNELSHSGYSAREGKSNSNSDSAEKSAKKSKKTTVSANEKAISKTKPSKESNENSKTKTLMQVSNPHELNEKMDPSLLKSFKLNLDKSIEKFLESNKEDNWEGNAVPTKSVSKKPSQPTASAFKTVSKSISTNACSEPDVLVQKFESALGIQASSSISTETAKKAKQTDLQGTRDQEKSALDLGLVNKKLDTKPEHLRFDKHKSVKPISVATIPKPHSLPLAPHFLHGKATSSQQEKSIHASSSKSHSLSSQDPSPSYPSPPFSSSLYPSPPNLTPLIPFLPNPSSLYSSPNPSSLYSSSLNPSSLNSSLSSQHPSLHLSSLNPSSSNAVKSLSSTERFPQYSSFIPAITSTTTTSTTSSSSSSQLLPSENVLLTMRALNVMKMKFGKTFTFSATERIKEKEKEVEIEKEEGRLIATNHFTTYQMEKETVTTSSSISSTAFKTQSSKSMHSFMNSLDPRLSIFLNENAMKAKENEKGIEKEEGKVKIKEWNLEKDAEMEGEEKMKGLRMEENREGKETKFIQNQKSPPLKENEGEEDEGEEEEEKEEKKDGVIEKEKEKVIKHFHDGISMDVKQYLLQNFGKLPVEWRLERGSGDNSIYIHEMDEKNEKKEENRLIEIHDFMSKKSVEKVVEEGKETKEGNEENEGREEEERGGIVGEETEVEKVKVGEKQREKGAGEMVGRGRKKEKRKRKSNIESIQSPYKKLLNYKHYDKDREEDDGDGDGVDKNSDKNDDKNIVNSNLTEKEVENKKNVEDEDYGNDDVHDDDAAEVLIQLNQNLQSGDFTEKKKNELEKEKGKGKEKDKQIVMLHDNGDDGNDGDDSNDNIKVNEDDDDDENHNMDIGHSIQDKFIIIYNDFKESEKELEENRLAVQNNINNLKEVERKANLNSTLEKRLDEIKVKMNHDLTIAKLSENKYKSQRQKLFKLLEETRIQSIKEEERQLDAALSALEDYQRSGKSMLREEVTGSDIAEIVSKWTGIPVSKLQQSEREKLLHLDEELHQRVVGQDAAVQAIAEAIQRSRAGLSDPNRPIASFMFLGPTGVGKTELAKALAAYLFNTEDSLVRIDMSEYMEKHAVSRLIGAPPGYVGYEEGGQLTEAVRRRPYAVLLFDEIEKAHGDVFNIFLQILDDGRVTDSQGRTVNFNNTVIIMTSNIGSQYILSGLDMAGPANAVYESVKERVLNAARANFRPEFMNRVDEFIVFRSLDADQIERIVRLQIERLEKRLKDRKIEIRISDAAVKLLSNLGYDPSYGARPVKRVIQQHVENALAKGILRGDFGEEDMVDIDVEIVGSTNGGLPTQKLTFTRVPRMASPSSYDPMAYMPM